MSFQQVNCYVVLALNLAVEQQSSAACSPGGSAVASGYILWLQKTTRKFVFREKHLTSPTARKCNEAPPANTSASTESTHPRAVSACRLSQKASAVTTDVRLELASTWLKKGLWRTVHKQQVKYLAWKLLGSVNV